MSCLEGYNSPLIHCKAGRQVPAGLKKKERAQRKAKQKNNRKRNSPQREEKKSG